MIKINKKYIIIDIADGNKIFKTESLYEFYVENCSKAGSLAEDLENLSLNKKDIIDLIKSYDFIITVEV